MKSSFLLPTVTALVGFSIAWVAKPGQPVSSSGASASAPTDSSRAARPANASRTPDAKRSNSVNPKDFPLADQLAAGPKTRSEARMMRLAEALGLSIDQQGSIVGLVETVQATANPDASVIEDLSTRGKAIEDGLKKLLTPEQFAKLQEMRDRERDNRYEMRAQSMLNTALADVDLSADQRDEVLDRLRQKAKADLQVIPASATMLLDNSMLPTGGKELSVDGVLVLNDLGQEINKADPIQNQEAIQTAKRVELERLLECFDGVLTPAQIAQYQAVISEQNSVIDRMRELARARREGYTGPSRGL